MTWTSGILTLCTANLHQEDQEDQEDQEEENQFDGHGFMVNVLVGMTTSRVFPLLRD